IRGLRQVARQPNVVLTSPKVRAMQTAEIAGALFARPPIVVNELASPDAIDIIGALARRSERVILVVGHEPTLSQTAEVLCTLSRSMCFIELEKAGCICIDVEFADGAPVRQAAIKWIVTSKMLRAITESPEPGES